MSFVFWEEFHLNWVKEYKWLEGYYQDDYQCAIFQNVDILCFQYKKCFSIILIQYRPRNYLIYWWLGERVFWCIFWQIFTIKLEFDLIMFNECSIWLAVGNAICYVLPIVLVPPHTGNSPTSSIRGGVVSVYPRYWDPLRRLIDLL